MYRRHMAEGRLADPECSMGTDPRSDPRMVEALAQFGLDANMPVVPLTIDAPLEERRAYAEMCEAGIGAVLDAFASAFPTRMASPLRRRRSPVRTATTSRSTSVARTSTVRCPRWCIFT